MSDFKITGKCTVCDGDCFEIVDVFKAGELYPGEPKRIGAPLEGAMRVTFLLLDGTHCDMTFCASCAELLMPEQYAEIWRKTIRTWNRELEKTHPGEEVPDWLNKQYANGILGEITRVSWQEHVNG